MLDVVDQVFPTVLEKVLHTTPQSEKVLHSSTSVRKTAGCLKFSSLHSLNQYGTLFVSSSQDLWVMWTS